MVAAGGWLMAARSSDVMADLGIESGTLRQDVLLNLKEPTWFFFNSNATMRKLARRVPETSRAATVRALGKIVRTYVESATFRQDWLQDLRTYYPYDDTYSPENLAKQQQENEAGKAALNGQIANLDQAFTQLEPAMLQMAIRSQLIEEERQLTSLTGDERTVKSRYVADMKKMLTLPPTDFKKQYLAYIKQQAHSEMARADESPKANQERIAQYRRQKAEFDAHADFRPLLKKRLQDFITLSSSVDFDARLVSMGYKQEFANPVYQRKPAEWKFLYRLGKEPVMAANTFAQEWIASLH